MRGIHIQRPIVVTEKQKLYGDVFQTTQDHQHTYECVQPLQGLITFGEPKDNEFYRDNLSWKQTQPQRPQPKTASFPDWDYAIYGMLVVKFGMGVFMLFEIDKQTAYNDVYLTNFMPSNHYSTYSVEGAGMTNPLYCLLIALSLVIFSVIIGLTQSKKYMFHLGVSFGVLIVLFVLQGVALGLHIMMLVKLAPDSSYYCLTSLSMIILHALTFVLSWWGLVQLALAPQSPQTKRMEDKTEMVASSRVTTSSDGATIMIEPKENQNTVSRDAMKAWTTTGLTYEDIQRETFGNFWLCVVEDLNTILCYAFVVRACDAQSAIRDDSTTFFDVLCIVFLGFLQHVSNVLMIFHAHIEKYTNKEMLDMPASSENEVEKKQAVDQ